MSNEVVAEREERREKEMSQSHQLSRNPSVAMKGKLSKPGQIHENDTGQIPPKSAKLNGVWACGSEGERLTGSQKVVGSSPTRSTKGYCRQNRTRFIRLSALGQWQFVVDCHSPLIHFDSLHKRA